MTGISSGSGDNNSSSNSTTTTHTSSSSPAIFSLRIVTVDHYMQFPVPELDPCYSEFRGSVVSKVPVIRIFGTDADGTKTCAHVHGVFPYMYVPYDDVGKPDAPSDADRLTYQMAASLDKALNISLGQSSSDAEHVFKIVHVQGIPFYGYHQKAHQFLKIYLYNPGLIRRVGTLLQNGAILGRIFQPHEVHVPYVLQFMIDYNLYGMSFLHSPADQLHYRTPLAGSDAIPAHRRRQILKRLDRTSTSQQECDIIAAYILNRLEINADTTARSDSGRSHANPGIATIWTDERIRRQRLAAANAIDKLPALEVPLPEERPLALPTDSNQYHLDALRSKLDHASDDTNLSALLMDQSTLNGTQVANQTAGGKFNLRRLLTNSVYPAECSQQTGNLLNASYIVDHQRKTRPRRSQRSADMQTGWLNDSIVDESLVLSLSQAAAPVADVTLNEVEFDLLNVMQQLEQNDEDAVIASPIDGDSILARLSQIASQSIRSSAARSQNPNQTVTNTSPIERNAESDAAPPGPSLWGDSDFDPDDDLLNDFSICLNEDDAAATAGAPEPIAKCAAKDPTLTRLRIPQLDGASDADTPRKQASARPKYAPLNVTVQTPVPQLPKRRAVTAANERCTLEKRLRLSAPSSEHRSIDLTQSDDDDDVGDATPVAVARKSSTNGNERFVDCRLRAATPIRSGAASMCVLRTEAIPAMQSVGAVVSDDPQPAPLPVPVRSASSGNTEGELKFPKVRLRRYTDIETACEPIEQLTIDASPPTSPTHPRRVLRARTTKTAVPVAAAPAKPRARRVPNKKSSPTLNDLYDRIDCHVSRKYDENHNFFPEPGPSTINYYENVDLPGYYAPMDADQLAKARATVKPPATAANKARTKVRPRRVAVDENYNSEPVVIVPLLRANTFDEVLSAMEEYAIPYSHTQSDEDVSVDALEAFSSDVLSTGEGLNARKRKHVEPKPLKNARTGRPSTPTKTAAAVDDAVAQQQPSPPSDLRILQPLLRAPTHIEVFDTMLDYDIPHETAPEPDSGDVALVAFDSDVLTTGEGLNARKLDNVEPEPLKKAHTRKEPKSASTGHCILLPLLRAPNYVEVLETMHKYEIPYVTALAPFFGDAADAIARAREVGPAVLHIATRTLDDLDDFVSDVLDNDQGLAARKNALAVELLGQPATNGKQAALNAKQMRRMMETDRPEVVRPLLDAPTPALARQWVSQNVHVQNNGDYGPAIASNGIASADTPSANNSQSPQCVRVSQRIADRLAPTSPEIIEASPPDEPNRNARHRTPHRRSCTATPASVKPRSVLGRLRNARLGATDSPNMFATSPAASSVSEVIHLDDDDDNDDGNDAAHVADESQLFGPRSATAASAAPTPAMVYGLTNRGQPTVAKKLVSDRQKSPVAAADHSFGITGATLENTFDFKLDLENLQTANANTDFNYLTIMSIEVHVLNRGNLQPDPENDAIVALFYNIQNNVPEHHGQAECVGILVQTAADGDSAASAADVAALRRMAQTLHPTLPIAVCAVRTERDLMQKLLALVAQWDPDIFAGYEIEMASWGYVLARGQVLNINLKMMLSRVPSQYQGSKGDPPSGTPQHQQPPAADEAAPKSTEPQGEYYGSEYAEFEVRLSGRIFLDVWRLMRSEISLTSYTFESCMYHVLHRRCPRYALRDLTRMWRRPAATLASLAAKTAAAQSVRTQRWTVLEYYLERVHGSLELLNQLDLIGRTCELAKLFGIQFYEVLSRGSQFRVESMMLRMAKPKNIIPVSPSVQQRAHMRAPEYLPLILEPLSRLYTDSLIVLDFQSLYPSQIIAYNYCFSTCLGRVEHLGQSDPFEFGASQLRMPPKLLRKLIARDLVTVSPCGVAFVSAAVREGVLPRMLREILDTRLMVKQSMKLHRDDRLLQRVLHSRQLGLKLMANVTYGYTAANFSGRMPCVEIGDSVVSKGRETLERAIQMVTANKSWRSRVIYGDTDSMFVLVPGRTREQAFAIGKEIADAVTQANPDPVKLKLEKVYQPSILQTKKRYVGYMYETADQPTPVYEAKGIETVRRDGCPAVAKMLEKTLKILFETCDVSAVKRYVCRQFTKIMAGRANLQDFTFAKEFRGVAGYKPGASVPSLELARRWLQTDRRAEPRRGERVPYVIVNGAPGVPLIRLVRSPLEFMADDGLTINAVYYISKVIVPALNRCLLLIGADAGQWYAELPRPQLTRPLGKATDASGGAAASTGLAKKSTISQYFATTSCPTDCGAQTKQPLCGDCQQRPHHTAVILTQKMAHLDRRLALLQRTCAACCADAGAGWSASERCASLDCPVLHVRCNGRRAHAQVAYLRELVEKYCA